MTAATVIVDWPTALPHQPAKTVYKFADDRQANMFLHSLRREAIGRIESVAREGRE